MKVLPIFITVICIDYEIVPSEIQRKNWIFSCVDKNLVKAVVKVDFVGR